VPPAKAQPPPQPGELVPVASLPLWARLAFQGVASLNRVQSRIFPTAFRSNENMLVCAPTGAGKTNIAMIAVLREVGQHIVSPGGFGGGGGDEGGGGGAYGAASGARAPPPPASSSSSSQSPPIIDKSAFKIVYVAPMKALAAEVTQNFSRRLQPLGLKVRELTGDMQLTKRELQETQMIVTTPEKWDVITRKGGDVAVASLVRLLILDEVHLLADERGPVIETLVARTLRQVEASQSMIRIVGLSATLPNYKDVGEFLR
jgi:activating signal cointegrator complex subunit 3